jgi:carbamoyltransferase
MTHASLGAGYGASQVQAVLSGRPDVRWAKVEGIEWACANLLARGKIVGWFQGRMEMGPRALGNRSILADPRHPGMKDLLNHRVKHRESFRPFAPAVLADRFGEFFEAGLPSRFMLVAAMVRPEKREVIPAVTHVDGSARVQIVPRDMNGRFHRLIEAFDQITGVPVVLNTSLNVRGEPIACTPEDALACLTTTEMDVLAVEDMLVWKTGSPPPMEVGVEAGPPRHGSAKPAALR